MTGPENGKQVDGRRSDGPSTLGGHASHTGGAWLLILVIAVIVYWLFLR